MNMEQIADGKVRVGAALRAQQIEQLAATRMGLASVEEERDGFQRAAKAKTRLLDQYRHAARRLEVALGLAPGAELPSTEDEAQGGEGEAAE